MVDVLFLIGRIMLGLFFLMMGSNHFMQVKMMAGYAQSKGVPFPTLSVMGTGLMLLLGGLSVITGIYPDVGVGLIVAFLVPTSFMMHNFWAIEDPQMKMVEMTQFMKNMALAGSALMFLVIPEPWELGLG